VIHRVDIMRKERGGWACWKSKHPQVIMVFEMAALCRRKLTLCNVLSNYTTQIDQGLYNSYCTHSMLACVGGERWRTFPFESLISVCSDNFLLELVFCVSGLWSSPNSEMKAPQKLMILALLDFSGYFSMKFCKDEGHFWVKSLQCHSWSLEQINALTNVIMDLCIQCLSK
jgi:hypothetical protein